MLPRLSLTATITALGIAVGIAPAAITLLALVFVPATALDGFVGEEIEHRLDLARADLATRHVTLTAAVAQVPDRQLGRAAQHPAAGQALQERLRRTIPEVVVRSLETDRARAQSPIGVSVHANGHTMRAELPVDNEFLANLREEHGLDFALVSDGEVIAAVGDAPEITEDWSMHQSGSDAIWRIRDLNVEGRFSLIGVLSGTGLAVITETHGAQLRTALLLLALAGAMSGIAGVVAVNRRLAEYATAAERITSDSKVRLPVAGRDPAARLAATLNSLGLQLEERFEELTTALDRLDRSVSAIAEGICLWGTDGSVQLWNPAAAALTGIEPGDDPEGAEPIRFLRGERTDGDRRVLLPRADGTRIAVDLSVRRTRDGETLQVFRDATPRLAIEKARSNFLVTIAHELRTPLTTIAGYVDILHTATPGTPGAEEAMARLRAAAERLAEVVAAVGDSAALVEERLPVSLDETPLKPVVEQAVADLDEPDREVEYGPFTDTIAQCDPQLVGRILREIVDNAHKYGQPPVTITASRDGDHVKLVVEDAGPALPVEMREAVMEPFSRADPDMLSDVGGIGLGLFIASRKAAAMGGDLCMDEIDGHTAVVLRLPVA